MCVFGGERDLGIDFLGRYGRLSGALTPCHQSLSHRPHTHVLAPLGAQGQLAVKCFSVSSYRAAVLTLHFTPEPGSAAGVSSVGVIFGVLHQDRACRVAIGLIKTCIRLIYGQNHDENYNLNSNEVGTMFKT